MFSSKMFYKDKKKGKSVFLYLVFFMKNSKKKNQIQLKLVMELCIFKLFNIYIKELT